jgi:PAS domain S-box-containing protein
MADAVMVLDARGEALAANAAWDALHNGVGSEGANLGTFEEAFEVTGLDGQPVPPEGWPATRALHGEGAHDYVFHLLDRRTGTGFVASYSAVPVTLEGERYVVVSAHDITDAVRTKEALEDQLRLTKSITDNADSALVMLDVNGHFTFINPAFTRITGYTEEDLQGRTVHEVVHYKYPDGRPFPIEECPIDNSYWNLQPIRGHEDVFVRKDGSLFPVVCAVEPLEKNGQTVGGVLEFRDVTREKFREQALRFLLDLAEATRPLRDPVAITELSARMLGEHLQADRCAYAEVEEDEDSFTILHDWSPRLRSTTGKYSLTAFGSLATQELRAGRTIVVRDVDRELTPEDGADTFNSIGIKGIVCCSLIKGGRLAALMAVHQSHPRDWKPEEVELIQMVVERCWSEIERARAERALVRSEERLSTILEIATIGIIVNDVAGRFVYANAPLLRMLGYTEEDVTQGRLNWSMIQAPDRLESDDEALAELRVRGVCTPYETEYIARDGRRVPVYVGAAFVPGSGGDGLLGAAFVTDLTTLKEAQHELLALNAELDQRVKDRTAELERANEEMSAFTYHVSHDLRAPLRAIVGTSRMVQEDYGEALPEQARALLDRQVAAANKLGTLIDELLKLSRLARDVAQAQDLDMTELAREVADEHAEDNERVVVEVQDGMNAKGDPRLLRLLLSNLISNALRYSPDGGTVTVGRNGEAFFVRDQGIGFDMQYANKLFMPFERLVTESQFPGTGVGLANAKRVIDHHRGRIWAESEPGKGATFFFTLGELQGA